MVLVQGWREDEFYMYFPQLPCCGSAVNHYSTSVVMATHAHMERERSALCATQLCSSTNTRCIALNILPTTSCWYPRPRSHSQASFFSFCIVWEWNAPSLNSNQFLGERKGQCIVIFL